MNSKTTNRQHSRLRNTTLFAAVTLLVAGTGIWITLATGGSAAAGKQAGSPSAGRVTAAGSQLGATADGARTTRRPMASFDLDSR
jgi:hypothetical protein